MDKYVNDLKFDQMKALAAGGDYESAAEIADSINWRKVRNVSLLVKAGDIYVRQKRYEEAKEILLMAYDRSPIGRMIIYRLAEISIKMKNLEEAEEYYNEFIELAPHDNLKYVLRYKISKAKGTDIQTQIAILEELKEAEYTEEWAYRLAVLYHKAGEAEKCIDVCDELILWFGDGIYVERALELKMLYQPLTKSQEGKYRAFKQRRDGVKEVRPQEETVVQIPLVQENVERFNTANLQEELAKSMQQIMDATEKETVDVTMDSIKKLVDDIPYLKMPSHETGLEAEKQINASLRDNFKEMMSEEEDAVSDWEKTRRAAQAALMMAQQQKLEYAKEKAFLEAQEIMERLADMIPKLDAGITPTQMLKEKYLRQEAGTPEEISNEERAVRAVADMNDMLQQQIDRLQEEVQEEKERPEGKEKSEAKEGLTHKERTEKKAEPDLLRKIKQAKPNFDAQIGLRPYMPRQLEQTAEPIAEEEQILNEEPPLEETPKEQTAYEGGLEEEISEEEFSEAKLSEEELSEEELSEEMRLAEAEFYGVPPERLSEEKEKQAKAEPEDRFAEDSLLLKQDTKEIKTRQIEKALQKQTEESIEIEEPESVPQAAAEEERAVEKLSDGQKAIFSYFVPVAGMEGQICQVLSKTLPRLTKGKKSAEGNILIQGGNGCGKTVLATALIKALQKEVKLPKGKVGKIDAKALNQKDLIKLLKKVAGGALIIERASEISKETAVKLSLLLDSDKSGILLIMEDTRAGLESALRLDEGFSKKFTEKIKIPVFTSDELVEFGQAYAHDLDYEIDNMGVLALYNRISNIQRLDQATTLTEVKEIVDEAIANAEKKTIKKAISIITSRRYTEDDYVILREKDFEA